MKENIRAKLLGLCRRLEELDAMLAAPDAADDMKRFTELSRERAEIEVGGPSGLRKTTCDPTPWLTERHGYDPA